VVAEPPGQVGAEGVLGPSGLDAQVAGGLAEGPAVRPLNEQDRLGPAHGRGPRVAEAGEVLVVPLLLKERGDVLGAVGPGPERCLGAVGA
jgi:hypothetical protein